MYLDEDYDPKTNGFAVIIETPYKVNVLFEGKTRKECEQWLAKSGLSTDGIDIVEKE
jgi:hypothetical protein